MHEDIVMKTAVATIPHWYASECAQDVYTLTVDKEVFRFQSHSPLTPKLVLLHEYIQNHLKDWIAKMPASPTPRSLQQVEEDIAVRWLEIANPAIKWERFIAYIEHIRLSRTAYAPSWATPRSGATCSN